MVKYYLKGTDFEVKVGNALKISVKAEGNEAKLVEAIVDEANLSNLLAKGVLEERQVDPDPKEVEEYFKALKPYIRRFARRNKITLPEALGFLTTVMNVSMNAYLTLLLEQIAEVKNRGKKRGSRVYWLKPSSGFRPVKTTYNSFIIPFYNEEDAMEAWDLIKPLLPAFLTEYEEQEG